MGPQAPCRPRHCWTVEGGSLGATGLLTKGHCQPGAWPVCWMPPPSMGLPCAPGSDTVLSKAGAGGRGSLLWRQESLGAVPRLEGHVGNFCLRRAVQMGPWAPGYMALCSCCFLKWRRGSGVGPAWLQQLRHEQRACWLPCRTPGHAGLAAGRCPPGEPELSVSAIFFKGSSWETGHWGL